MRMVYTDAPDEDFFAARDRLVDAFAGWAHRVGRAADPFVVEVMIEQRWRFGDGLLCRWQPADLRYALIDYFPRTVSTNEWSDTIPTVHAFVDFLFAADLADGKCADADTLHAAADALADEFDLAMADETRYGPAKYWAMRMLAAGINLEDAPAIDAFMTGLQDGRVPVDQAVLDRVMQNQMTEDDELPPPLPPVDPPDPATIAAAAAGSVALTRVLRFTEWIGDGRALTANGKLTLADAGELITVLDLSDVIDPETGGKIWKTTSSADLYELSVVFAWAKAARFVRVVKGRVLPVKSSAKVIADPVAAAHRAFEAFFAIGLTVCPSGYLQSAVPHHADDITFSLLLAMYMAQRPIEADELEEIVGALLEEVLGYDEDDPDEGVFEGVDTADVERLLAQLDLLGAISHTPERTTLTPLGTALFAQHLRDQDFVVPTIADMLDETAEVVVATAADTPTIGNALLNRWREHHGERGIAALRALAARTDDPEHRALAEAYGGRRTRPHAVSAGRRKGRRR